MKIYYVRNYEINIFYHLKKLIPCQYKITLTKPCPGLNSGFYGVLLPETNVCLIGFKDRRLISRKISVFRTLSQLVVDLIRETRKQTKSVEDSAHARLPKRRCSPGSASASPSDLYGSNVVEVAIILTKTSTQYLVLCVYCRLEYTINNLMNGKSNKQILRLIREGSIGIFKINIVNKIF